MNEIKLLLAETPVLFAIFDFEGVIRRRGCGLLRGRHIRGYDLA